MPLMLMKEGIYSFYGRKREVQDKLNKMKNDYHSIQHKTVPTKIEKEVRKRSSSVKRGEMLYQRAIVKEENR